MKKKFLGIITARAGSKRIPKKNVRLLNGKPLICWTINEAKKSLYLDRVVVTTDSEEIRKIAIHNQVEAPFVRPESLSTDVSTSESAISHAIDWYEKNQYETYECIVLLQPTSPFRTGIQIDNAIKKFQNNTKANALISVRNFDNRLHLIMNEKKRYINSYLDDYQKETDKKEIPDLFRPNGAIYIIKVKILNKYHTVYPPKTIPYVMDAISSLDIDDEYDFRLAELVAAGLKKDE